MPFLLNHADVVPALSEFESVLIVPCRFCPAASAAVTAEEPYLQPHRGTFETAAYERKIAALKAELESRGIRTDVFRSRMVHQFVMCTWTPKRRRKLAERARAYDALVVLGCEGAVKMVHDTLGTSTCQVFQGMETKGLMVVTPRLSLPCTLSITLDSLTPITHQSPEAVPWHRA